MSELAAPAAPRARDGLTSLGAGVRFVVLRPKSWRLAIVPVLVATVTLALTSGLALWGAVSAADALAANVGGAWHGAADWALRVLLGALAVLASVVVSFALAQPLSGPALDDLSREHEVALGGVARPDGPWVDSLLRSLRVTLTSLAVALPLLGGLALVDVIFPIAMVVTVPLKVAITALMVAWDLLDSPFSQRQMGVRARVAFIRAHRGAVLLFGVVSAAMLFVPGVSLFLLPIGVAGATHLVVRRERALAPSA